MPRYEYRCRECGTDFELNRPMSKSGAPADCPQGHDDTVKLLSTVSVGGTATASGGGATAGSGASGGGCCGGGCCG